MSSADALNILWVVTTSSEGHSYSPSEWLRFAVVVFNFLVFVYLLYRFGRKPVSRALSSRRKQFLDELRQARESKEEAQRLLEEARAKLEAADAEAEALVEDAKRRAESLAQEIIQTAELSARKIMEEAESAAKAETAKVFVGVKREVVARAVGEAERMLRERLTVEDDKRLVAKAVENLVQDDRE